jgi:Tfp pilus assembly protein PilO
MARDFTTRKRTILGGVICLVAADLALAAYSFQLTAQPLTTGPAFVKQENYIKKLKASVDRAEQIREDMPNTQRDCEKFEHMLLPASSGYSSVLSELHDLAKKSGVRPPDVGFKPTPVPSRGLIEVAMESTIEGDYKNVILFLNGLQRSANIYEVESLALAPQKDNKGPANAIKVGLHLKTYFRAGA